MRASLNEAEFAGTLAKIAIVIAAPFAIVAVAIGSIAILLLSPAMLAGWLSARADRLWNERS